MRVKISGDVDEETKKEIREVLLGEARGAARADAQAAYKLEFERVSKDILSNLDYARKMEAAVVPALRQIVSERWTTISGQLRDLIREEIKVNTGPTIKEQVELMIGTSQALRSTVSKLMKEAISRAL